MKHRDKKLLTIRISNIPLEIRGEILKEMEGKPTPSDKEFYEDDLKSLVRQRPDLQKYFPQFNIR
jgi:hypothetical protein